MGECLYIRFLIETTIAGFSARMRLFFWLWSSSLGHVGRRREDNSRFYAEGSVAVEKGVNVCFADIVTVVKDPVTMTFGAVQST